ncbi:hypothetical protein BKA70DRAFT_1148555 [Coprinopsis sp. MPI-PUGE-AT-0042]|nr:hypothetical protein BKA70DRAFT_1148555 [Coprinopsis sp. MPI-PUGE-AT-0042]
MMLGIRSTSSLLSSLRAFSPVIAMGAQRRAFAAAAAGATKASTTKAKTSSTTTKKASATGTTKAKKTPATAKVAKPKKVAAPPKPKSPKFLTDEQKASLPPRRPATPFVRFYTSRINEAKANQQTMSIHFVRDLAKESGALWKEMTLTEKAKYAIPEAEHQAYLKRSAEWEKNIDRPTLDAINKSRRAKGMNKIRAPAAAKRPPGPYALFMKDFYSKHVASDLSFDEKGAPALMGKAAETWKTLSDQEKKVCSCFSFSCFLVVGLHSVSIPFPHTSSSEDPMPSLKSPLPFLVSSDET